MLCSLPGGDHMTEQEAAVRAERERCADIAENLPVAALHVSREAMVLLRRHLARVAARIRDGV